MDILFASNNQGKFKEASSVFKAEKYRLLSPAQLNLGTVPDPEENGHTYEENAVIKASAFFNWSKTPSLADDTGLEVAALGGRPGLHSARYSGPDATGPKNIAKLLSELAALSTGGKAVDRTARFVGVLALVGLYPENLIVRAELEGEIALETRGGGGFGYDSVFVVKGYGKTLAELKEAGVPVKTHRVLALEKILLHLSKFPPSKNSTLAR